VFKQYNPFIYNNSKLTRV